MKTRMNLPIGTLFIAANVLFASCNKEEFDLIGIDARLTLSYENLDVVIPATDLQGEIDVAVGFDATKLQELIAGHGYGIEQVKEVRFLAARMRMDAPAGATFDALGQVHLHMAYGGMRRTIASVPHVPDGATELVLVMDGSDLTDDFMHQDAELRVLGRIDGPVTEDLHTLCDLSFTVVVGSGN